MVMASMVFMNRVYQRRRTKQPMARRRLKNSRRTNSLASRSAWERASAPIAARARPQRQQEKASRRAAPDARERIPPMGVVKRGLWAQRLFHFFNATESRYLR